MPPIDFMFGPRPHFGGQVIQQNITIKQPSGFLGFMTGLFGGLRGFMPGMMYPTMPYYPTYTTPSLFMNPMMHYPMMQYPMLPPQMSPYAYMNQQQVQQPFLMDGDNSTPSTQMKNLETFFKDKGYVICPEADGNYTVADKNGKLLASGTYEEVRDKLFEINEEESIDETDDDTDVSDADDLYDDDGDDDISTPRKQGVPSGWYKSSADTYKHLKNIDVSYVSKAAKKEGQSDARYVVSHCLLPSKFHGCLNMKQINALANELVAYNKECFNNDGSFKEGFSTDKMVIPNSKWIAKNIIGNEAVTGGQRLQAVKTHVTKNGNIQYNANLMAQNNYRETFAKDVYYNNKTKTHIFYFSEAKKVVSLPEVRSIDANGNWRGKDGKVHTRAELETLAEERLEQTASSSSGRSNNSVPDNNGSSDTTNLFVEDDEV